jgi:hypothetical protein
MSASTSLGSGLAGGSTGPRAQPPTVPASGSTEPDPRYACLPTEDRIERTVAALRARGFEVVVVDSAQDAHREMLARIPAGSEVLDGPSRSLEATGVLESLQADPSITMLKPRLRAMDRATQGAEMRRISQAPGIAIGSVHAVTEAGEVLVASGTGSQLGPYAYGAGRVVWVVGTQKIVATFAEGLDRIERYSLPLENARARAVYGHDSAIARLLVLRREYPPGRTTMILVRQNLGF